MNKLEQAMEDHKQEKWQQADSVYEEILIEEPENADVMYLLATSKMSQNKNDEALEIIDKAIDLNEKAPAYLQLKASVLARKGQADEALNVLKKALKENPNLYQGQILAGHLYYTKGDIKNAEKHFHMAEKIDNKKPEAHVNLAKILLEKGDLEQAINLLRTVEKEHPEQASVKMMMGEAFIESGAYNFAENYFQKVLAMHPEYELAGLFLGIAKLYTGDKINAEKLITAFNQTHPNTKEGIAALGLFLYHTQRYRAAVEYLRKAISTGLSPLSWRSAFFESLAQLGQYKPAIEFYEQMKDKIKDKALNFRLGELHERNGDKEKAINYYKQIDEGKTKFTSAQIGIARCKIENGKFKKAEKICQNILETTGQNAESLFLLVTSLLFQNKQKEADSILDKINYSKYTDVYKKIFRLQHGLLLDNMQNYEKAFKLFTDENKKEKQQVQNTRLLSEKELKKVLKFDTKIEDDRKDPIFLIGLPSVGLNYFIDWLYKQGIVVLNDRLISIGRPDILFTARDMKTLKKVDDDMVRLERKIYHQKAKVLLSGIKEENATIVDCMYINPEQMILVKKFFPQAKIVLLNRDTADVWLNQKAFGAEPIDSKDWNETINQIISMGLNLEQINVDKWLENDKETLKQLSIIFDKDLIQNNINSQDYWRKSLFPKGHWKNYKNFLGQ